MDSSVYTTMQLLMTVWIGYWTRNLSVMRDVHQDENSPTWHFFCPFIIFSSFVQCARWCCFNPLPLSTMSHGFGQPSLCSAIRLYFYFLNNLFGNEAGLVWYSCIKSFLEKMYHNSLPDGADYFSLQSLYSAHYTPVLPVLIFRGGRDISQGNLWNMGHWEDCFSMSPPVCWKRGTLGVLIFNVPQF